MEITEYIDFIKEQFKDLDSQNNLIYSKENNYLLTMKNKFLEIYFSTEKYSNGISVYITDIKENNHYSIFEAITKKIGQTKFLTKEEVDVSINFNDDIKSIIYNTAIFIKNNCQDLLNGDFNSLK